MDKLIIVQLSEPLDLSNTKYKHNALIDILNGKYDYRTSEVTELIETKTIDEESSRHNYREYFKEAKSINIAKSIFTYVVFCRRIGVSEPVLLTFASDKYIEYSLKGSMYYFEKSILQNLV